MATHYSTLRRRKRKKEGKERRQKQKTKKKKQRKRKRKHNSSKKGHPTLNQRLDPLRECKGNPFNKTAFFSFAANGSDGHRSSSLASGKGRAGYCMLRLVCFHVYLYLFFGSVIYIFTCAFTIIAFLLIYFLLVLLLIYLHFTSLLIFIFVMFLLLSYLYFQIYLYFY